MYMLCTFFPPFSLSSFSLNVFQQVQAGQRSPGGHAILFCNQKATALLSETVNHANIFPSPSWFCLVHGSATEFPPLFWSDLLSDQSQSLGWCGVLCYGSPRRTNRTKVLCPYYSSLCDFSPYDVIAIDMFVCLYYIGQSIAPSLPVSKL